ncbi:protein SRC2-like [Telopea speciosissima]|uniref:protein SRC2-like n=1 Tax=Telopea speciosissima TaxID=54955 RepID=UPI001CC3332B|nr:protein SRC2-like [Telopea speciosissima]
MVSRGPLEVKVSISSAKDLKNVNWRYGPLQPYAVVWVDPNTKLSTRVDPSGDTSPEWDETLLISLLSPLDDSTTLFIDIVHVNAPRDTKPLIGSARLRLKEIIDDVGFGQPHHRTLRLTRPSGRPQGKLDATITVRDPRYGEPDPYRAAPYAVPPSVPAYGYSYPPQPQPYAVAGAGYPSYDYGSYGQGGSGYAERVEKSEKSKSKYGMGTGLAVGAVAGVLGGLALAEGADYVEDKIADNVAERVEDDDDSDNGGYGDDDGGYGGDDF